MKHLSFFLLSIMGKIRPQIMVSLLLLGAIAVLGIRNDMMEISVGCMAGIIALAKDVLQSDADSPPPTNEK